MFSPVDEVLLLSARMVGQPPVQLGKELVLCGEELQFLCDLFKYLLSQAEFLIQIFSVKLL